MARTNAVNFSGALQFPLANAATDLFKKEDVQILSAAVDLHNHTSGLGLILPGSAIQDGSIPGTKLANGAITSAQIAANTITSGNILDGTIVDADVARNTLLGTALVNGAIDMSKLALNSTFRMANYIQAAPAGSTTSSTASSMPSPYNAIPITVVGNNSIVVVLGSLDCVHSTVGGGFTLFCCANSSGLISQASVTNAYANGAMTLPLVSAFNALPAGSHNINIGWSTAGGTLSVNTGVYSYVLILEFMR